MKAPRADVYRTLLDPRAVATWKVPSGMTCEVHAFDPREGGAFRPAACSFSAASFASPSCLTASTRPLT
jgi:Activator of Hsp90 ATPase homolog 1-like protein